MEQYGDSTFDGAYAIESIVHAKDPLLVYQELMRVLKPGACFIESAWVLTEKYLPANPTHEKIKPDVVLSNWTNVFNSSFSFSLFVFFIAW